MPAARGTKRSASKASTTVASGPKNKKKRGVVQLDLPSAPKKRGRVLACGQGDVGQLGMGENVMETIKFKYISALGNNIVSVCAGGMHSVALDSEGKVWTCGCNDEGALGRPTNEDVDEGTPTPVTLPGAALKVTAGDSHTAALLDNGHVYAWGSFRDSHGSMGLIMRGREGKACKEPVRIDVGEVVVDIASGGDHLVMLSSSGTVYTMGCGEQGQLGRLSQRSASRDARQGFSALLVPMKVTLKGGASRVWAGFHATFALDAAKEKMYAWGLNNFGQLGIVGEKRRGAVHAPTQCEAFARDSETWSEVACGMHHTIALCDGRVYALGRREYGRLGLGDRAADADELEPIPALQEHKCVSIAASTSNSFAVTDTGIVLAWGMGSEGQLGTGSRNDALIPTAAELPTPNPGTPATKALAVAAGGQHTLVLVEETSVKEPSPDPEKPAESENEKVEDEVTVAKRPRTDSTPQEEEISSTSSAQVAQVNQVEDAKPQKVNGDENKDAPMEVDEIEKKEETTTEEKKDLETKLDGKAETDTSSQDTTDDDTKSQDDESQDAQKMDTTDAMDNIDKTEDKLDTIETHNGSAVTVETKPVDALPAATPITTTA